MSANPDEMSRRSPDELLSDFTQSRTLLWLSLALLVHAVAIGATSMGYVRDRWIDPEGAAKRKAVLEAKTAGAERPAAPSAGAGAVPTGSSAIQGDIPKDRQDAPMVKRVTELPNTNEIPGHPADIGISIDDTNVK